MDLKITGQGVTVNETAFAQTLEQPLDIGISLPDYCPDIVRILKCRVVPRISSKSVNGQSVSAEGNAAVNLIYLTEDGRVRSFDYIYPFSKSVETGSDCTDSFISICAKSEYVNCRAVTPRKADIHGSVSICVKKVRKKTADVIIDIDAPDIQLKRFSAPATMPKGFNEKYLIVDEEFELPAGQPPVAGIIRHDLSAAIKDCKIIGNKAVVKGDLTLNALYYSTDDKLYSFTGTIPFSQIVETDGISDDCECEAKVDISADDLRIQNSGDDKGGGFYLNARLCVAAFAVCSNEIPVILDAFSTEYETKLSKSDITFERIQQTVYEKFLCRKTLDFPDASVDSVLDFRCDTFVSDTEIKDRQLVINGVVQMCLIIADNEGVPRYAERPVEFRYCCDIDSEPVSFRCDPQVDAVAASYTITGDNSVEVRVELCVNAALYAVDQLSVVTDISVLENERKRPATKGALVIYYAKGDETVWDIARRYNTSPKHIKQVNSLEDDRLSADKTLLIPCK